MWDALQPHSAFSNRLAVLDFFSKSVFSWILQGTSTVYHNTRPPMGIALECDRYRRGVRRYSRWGLVGGARRTSSYILKYVFFGAWIPGSHVHLLRSNTVHRKGQATIKWTAISHYHKMSAVQFHPSQIAVARRQLQINALDIHNETIKRNSTRIIFRHDLRT